MLDVDLAAATDLGCRRSNNEDSFGYDHARRVYVVCDGMGGMAAGEVASATAVRAFVECFDHLTQSDSSSGLERRVLQSIQAANRAVRAAAAADESLLGMGTTLVCACLEGSRLVVGNVGDSRAYFARDGQCFQVTQDHSFLGEQVSRGWMTQEEAAASDMQSVITRALGAEDDVEPDIFDAEVMPGDRMLLSSDGLTRHVSDGEIAELLNAGVPTQEICDHFIALARHRGGTDNITCIVLRLTTA